MRIEWIGAHQQLIGQLAQWHHAQWHALYDGWTLQAAADELSLHAGSQGVPTTLLLLDDTAGLLGSVSLLQEDSPELHGHEGPWLGNLLVTPSARGRGAGRALVAAAVAHAARLQLPRLRLFTPEHAGFYQAMGWQIEAQAVLQATPVTIMTIAPLADPARRAQ